MVTASGNVQLGGLLVAGTASCEFRPGAKIALDLTPEAAKSLNDLISRTGDTPAALFRKAIGLYALAKQAESEGKAVGVATNPDSLETEFVGL